MKLWFKVQTWVTLLALFYIFFIFNDGHLGGLFLDAIFGLVMDWLKEVGHNIVESIVDSALHQ